MGAIKTLNHLHQTAEVITILNDTANMSLYYGYDDPTYYTVNGSNVLTFTKDRSPIDVTFAMTGSIPLDPAKKSIKLSSSTLLSHTNAPYLKGNTIIVAAFRYKFDYDSFTNAFNTIYSLYRDGTIFMGYTASSTYQDKAFDALIDDAFRRKANYEMNGHTILMWVTDNTTCYFYINNVLKYSHTFTGSASDVKGIYGMFPFANNFPQASECNLHEFRIYNKIYTVGERTTLFNDIATRYSLDTTNFPSATSLVINGTASTGQIVDLSYTYTQNSASGAGDFFIIWGTYANNSLSTGEYALSYMTVITGKKNVLSTTLPTITSGQYLYALLILYDDQGRSSKTLYRASKVIS
jgi:hypothetical protein